MTRCIGYAASSPPLHERISDRGQTRLRGLLDAGDPHGEVRTAWHAKETVRGIYGIESPALALRYTLQLADDLQHESCPPEINKLGRTIARWTPQITNWHISKVTNGPTEALNNLIKRIKRISVRVTQLRELPNPGPSLRRETQLGPPRHPSLPTEIHSYLEGSWAGTGLTQLKSGFVPFHRSVGLFPAWGCNPLGRGGCDLIGALIFHHREWPVHRLPGPGIGNDSIPQRRKASWEKMVGLCSVGLTPIVIPMLRRWLMAPVGSWERHRSGLIRSDMSR